MLERGGGAIIVLLSSLFAVVVRIYGRDTLIISFATVVIRKLGRIFHLDIFFFVVVVAVAVSKELLKEGHHTILLICFPSFLFLSTPHHQVKKEHLYLMNL